MFRLVTADRVDPHAEETKNRNAHTAQPRFQAEQD